MFKLEDPFDVLLSPENYRPFEYPTFGVNSQIYLAEADEHHERCEIKSQSTKGETHEANICEDTETSQIIRSYQSDLHNCPKHLIKHIVQCLGFPTSAIIQSADFLSVEPEVKECLKNLLGILELCAKGKIKSLSKELLKIVFEEGSQRNSKLKLIQNPSIKKAFQSSNPHQITRAKAILRQFAVKKLSAGSRNYVDHSQVVRKSINERYLQIFLGELKSGKVSERVSKRDKEWILQHKNF